MRARTLLVGWIAALLVVSSGASRADDGEGTVTVQVTGLRNDRGDVRAALFSSADGFPFQHAKAVVCARSRILNRKARIVFEEIPPGDYAVSVFHDEDGDGRFDPDWGSQKQEGFALSMVSGDPSRATFDQARFTLDAPTRDFSVTLHY